MNECSNSHTEVLLQRRVIIGDTYLHKICVSQTAHGRISKTGCIFLYVSEHLYEIKRYS